MLKRLITGSILVIYLITSAGFAINLHYCGSRISAVSIDRPAAACSKRMQAMKCCHDKKVEIKLTSKSVQSPTPAAVPFSIGLSLPFEPSSFLSFDRSLSQLTRIAPAHGPPFLTNEPLFVRNCIFRI